MAYDSRAVKISKEVKRAAMCIRNSHARGEFIRGYVAIARDESRLRTARGRGDKQDKEGADAS